MEGPTQLNTDTASSTAEAKITQNLTPVFFKLIDVDQEKTEKTVKDLTELAEKLEIENILQLHNIIHTEDDGYVSVFYLNLETGMKSDIAEKALTFLEYVFKNMFHKHPAFTEPEL